MSYGIGIDIGGTNIKVAAVSEDGELLESYTGETRVDSPDSWVQFISGRIKEIENKRGGAARFVGLAAPGFVARDNLSIASSPGKLPGLEGLNWTRALPTSFPVPVLNDAHAALIGEVWKGAGVGCQNALLLTLGTGVGGALLIDGRLYKGSIGRAGHMPMTLEQAIGNSTLPLRSAGKFTSTRQLVQAHLSGDPKATEVWMQSVYAFAANVASLINALDPEAIIIGGGIAQAGPALFEPLAGALNEMEWRPYDHRVRILPAALGDFAGTYGAAYHAMNAAIKH